MIGSFSTRTGEEAGPMSSAHTGLLVVDRLTEEVLSARPERVWEVAGAEGWRRPMETAACTRIALNRDRDSRTGARRGERRP